MNIRGKRYLLIFAAMFVGTIMAIVVTKKIDTTRQPVLPEDETTPILVKDNEDDEPQFFKDNDPSLQEPDVDPAANPKTGTPLSFLQPFRQQVARPNFATAPSPKQFQQQQFDSREGVPDWEVDPKFKDDVFTFVRLKYSEGGGYNEQYGGRRWRGDRGRWRTDYPDSDLNFSFRLQQLTSLKVNPNPIYLEPTDERLFDYPFLYMIEPQALYLSDDDVKALRRYFDNGGFMMVDDFWGDWEYEGFYREIKKVFPDRDAVPLTLEHPIFHCVYDLKELPQVPSMHSWQRWGVSYEREDAQDVDYRAFYDDKGRMSVIICHNTDLGDGWEREGQDKEYFRLFAERLSYPMGINIVVYAMTN